MSDNESLPNSYILNYSRHAEIRTKERKVSMSLEQTRKLETLAIQAQNTKGFSRTAFILDKYIFVIDVHAMEVITVMNSDKRIMLNFFIGGIDSVIVCGE